jgi:hypothetical protein
MKAFRDAPFPFAITDRLQSLFHPSHIAPDD